jgi:hypothetical protein
VRIRAVPLRTGSRCPLCREPVEDDAALASLALCPGCDVVHHRACVRELGGGQCATPGCGRVVDERQARVPRGERRAGGERTLLVELGRFAWEMALLWGLGLALFALVVAWTFAVVELRWFPLWTGIPVFCAPLVLAGVWQWVRGEEEEGAGEEKRAGEGRGRGTGKGGEKKG